MTARAWKTRGSIEAHPEDADLSLSGEGRWRARWWTGGQRFASRWCKSRLGAIRALKRIARRHNALWRAVHYAPPAWTPEDETACLMGGGLP